MKKESIVLAQVSIQPRNNLRRADLRVCAATLAPEKPAAGQDVPNSSGGHGTRVMIIGGQLAYLPLQLHIDLLHYEEYFLPKTNLQPTIVASAAQNELVWPSVAMLRVTDAMQ